MSKRWTEKEDKFLHAFFEAVGDYIGPHDLGRPAGAAAARVRALKASGAWDALTREEEANLEYRRLTRRPTPLDDLDRIDREVFGLGEFDDPTRMVGQ